MNKIETPNNRKRAKAKAKRVTIGLAGFGKISAIEGLHLTHGMKATFRALKRSGVSPQQRRAALIKKYGTAS
jgi:hypothetical protein